MHSKPKQSMPDQAVGQTSRTLNSTLVRHGTSLAATRSVPDETPIALVFDGSTQAVMMATEADLEDFAIGFAITERIITQIDEITRIEIVPQAQGVEARIWLKADQSRNLAQRRRKSIGPTGCGLCGIESLEQAIWQSPNVESETVFVAKDIENAMSALAAKQHLNAQTHAVHAAGFWTATAGLVAAREDVGRHNALDKLIGSLVSSRTDPATGMIVLTSRISVELVQKAAIFGTPVITAISAPTGLAVQTAETSGITLIGIARTDGFEIFTHPERIGDH